MTSSYNQDIIIYIMTRSYTIAFVGPCHCAITLGTAPLACTACCSSVMSMRVDGRLLQAHRKLQELGDLRGIDYLQSGSLYPEIGPDLAGLSALKLKVDEVCPT